MEDNNPDQQMPPSEQPTAPAPMPVDDVRPAVKTPPPLDDQAEPKPEDTKPLKAQKPTTQKHHSSSTNTAIVATVIIVIVIAALIVYAYTKNK